MVGLDVSALSQAPFGPGTGEIALSGLRCNGSEASLLDCPSGDNPECDHSDDAGLRCEGTDSVIVCECSTTSMILPRSLCRRRSTFACGHRSRVSSGRNSLWR